MPDCALVIGGPGGGKTTEALRLMDMVLKTDIRDPLMIGFVTFTRAARRVASTRAAEAFGGKPEALEHKGWFRTIHSICHKIVAPETGQLLVDDTASREWIQGVTQEEIDTTGTRESLEDYEGEFSEETTPAARALSIWDIARNRLMPYADVWKLFRGDKRKAPALERCREIVELYESAKAAQNKIDFTDLLLRCAQYRCTFDGAERWPSECNYPRIPVWFLDESQDNSPLMDEACQRIVQHARWVYVFGDPNQAIHTWCGADPKAFQDWPYHGRIRYLPKSYRCPKQVLDIARFIIKRNSDWKEHEFDNNGNEGLTEVISGRVLDSFITKLNPQESTLVLARANYQAAILAKCIDAAGLPWAPVRGRGGYNAPKRVGAALSCIALKAGETISPDAWFRLVNTFPSKWKEYGELLVRGTKTRLEDPDILDKLPKLSLKNLDIGGATEALKRLIVEDNWHEFVLNGRRIESAIRKYGVDHVTKPLIRIGSIHSAKGDEADHVVLWNQLSDLTLSNMRTTEGKDDERRVWYVASSRAKSRMTIMRETGRGTGMLIHPDWA